MKGVYNYLKKWDWRNRPKDHKGHRNTKEREGKKERKERRTIYFSIFFLVKRKTG